MYELIYCEGRFTDLDLEQICDTCEILYLNGLKTFSLVMLFAKQNEAELSHF